MSLDQRRSPRVPADWLGRYRFDGQKTWGWCRVIDISLIGAGLELRGAVPEDCTGLRVVVNVESPSDLRLVGECRYVREGESGRTLVGLQFGVVAAERRSEDLVLSSAAH